MTEEQWETALGRESWSQITEDLQCQTEKVGVCLVSSRELLKVCEW